ncbi:guanine nucleotide-binding protein G(q) subunit alpha [Salvelinus sp. IW2-2015]|uniref:guanine nucleotide-binding protein G(q) subunit alpha n=1 Tax=Salvelinus sp. IW2-2015 TaxID=2691554 RepID=UPI000CDFEDDF|nr:guanine nucleotide-binding protein G(q) subunit alpha [Salvelinus alpinus]
MYLLYMGCDTLKFDMACWKWCRRTWVCCLDDEERRTIAIDKEIQRILRQQKNRERKEIKVLLLGTGESGKTTFIRQMRIIHGNGFSEEERRDFAKLIYQNIFTAVKAMTRAMITLRLPYAYPENEMYARWMQDVDTVQVTQLDRGFVDAIRHLWADPGLRVCYSRRSEYQLLDSTEYYMTNLDRISAPNYIPTAQDVLRVRFPTTGIHDYSFTVKTITLRSRKRRDAQDAMKYIQKMYEQQAHSRDKKEDSKTLYPHFTCATDTNNIRKVFSDVKDTVLLKSLMEFGVI